jgi:hypothetical protein
MATEKRIFVQQRSAPYNSDGSTAFNIRKKSGVYIIFKNDVIDYIGYSGYDLYKTLYRHFQNWNDHTQVRVSYKNMKNITVRVIYTKTKSVAEKLERALIIKYQPKSNPNKYTDYELTSSDHIDLKNYINEPTNPIVINNSDLPF